MIGQPRMGPDRQPPRQQVPLTAGQFHRRAEQRVIHRPEPRRRHIPRPGRARSWPVPLMPERIGGQVHPLPVADYRRPVHPGAMHMRTGQGGQQTSVKTTIFLAFIDNDHSHLRYPYPKEWLAE